VVTELSVNGRQVDSFESLVSELGSDAFASPRRSTVPLVDYWRVPNPRLDQLSDWLGVPRNEDSALHFEYEVPVRRGRGKSSFTDLMILRDDVAIAIEAKFTEPRYESVASWLGTAPTMNRRDVVDGWLAAIETTTDSTINHDAIKNLPYQLIHRTASACCAGAHQRPVFVVYQIFGELAGSYYADDLRSFASAINARDRVRFLVLECPFSASETWTKLAARWDTKDRAGLGEQVHDALLVAPLFEFRQPKPVPIGA
jgi:hypothetical protein